MTKNAWQLLSLVALLALTGCSTMEPSGAFTTGVSSRAIKLPPHNYNPIISFYLPSESQSDSRYRRDEWKMVDIANGNIGGFQDDAITDGSTVTWESTTNFSIVVGNPTDWQVIDVATGQPSYWRNNLCPCDNGGVVDSATNGGLQMVTLIFKPTAFGSSETVDYAISIPPVSAYPSSTQGGEYLRKIPYRYLRKVVESTLSWNGSRDHLETK